MKEPILNIVSRKQVSKGTKMVAIDTDKHDFVKAIAQDSGWKINEIYDAMIDFALEHYKIIQKEEW